MDRPTMTTRAAAEYVIANSGPMPMLYDEIGTATTSLAERAAIDGTPGRVGRLTGRLLTLLVRMTNARNAVEIGTFTGTSTICIAQGLPDGGRLLSFDSHPVWPRLARQAVEQAGLTNKVRIDIVPALDGLQQDCPSPYDFAFIDADKANYPKYLEALIPLMTRGALIVADNALWQGQVYEEDAIDAATMGVKRYNEMVRADERLDSILLPIDDGLSIAIRK